MNKENKKLNKNNIENILSLSPLQEGILFYYLLNKESDYYLEQLSIMVSGKIDTKLFEKAWNIVTTSNEMLRTIFRWENLSNPIQIVLKNHNTKILFKNFSGCKDAESSMSSLIKEDKKDLFDLEDVPFRVTLYKLDDSSHIILISNHHILYDGWSNGIILKEFFETYNALINQEIVASEEKAKYREYIKWIGNINKDSEKKFWEEYLKDYKPKVILDCSTITDSTVKKNISNYSIDLSLEFINELNSFARNNNITFASLLYSAWGILLFHYCNENDIVFGTTVSIRPEDIRGISNTVGLCINTIPLRVMADGSESILSFVKGINTSLQERKEYEAASLTDIVAYNKINRDEELFQSIFVIENYPLSSNLFNQSNALKIESYKSFGRSNYDITVIAKTFDKGINFEFQYNSLIFNELIIKRMSKHYENILKEVITKAEKSLSLLNILSRQEKDEILMNFNNTEDVFQDDICIHEIFEKKAAENKDKVAIIQGTRFLSYGDLNEKSNKLARIISRKISISPNTAIGIMTYPSIEMIVGLMAILKAGGAYVPLDPDSPADRNSFILKDSSASMLLTTSDIGQMEFWSGETLLIDRDISEERGENLENIATPDNLAYIIYTSGSTGLPKGVMIEHRSLVNILIELEKRYPVLENDTFLLKTTYTFDISITEIMGWFVGNGRLAVLEKGMEKDPVKIIDAIEIYNVTHMNVVPSIFRYMLEYMYQNRSSVERISNLKYIFSGGEALKTDLVEKYYGLDINALLEDVYGPTEATIYISNYSLKDFKGGVNVPIGKPMSNLHAYIVDKHGRLQPSGVPGELCLSGVGISRGYVNRAQLTDEKFVKNPFIKEIANVKELRYISYYNKMYKTGDLARWMPDGNIEYLGRNDFQIKIRGFRIELEEIENKLLCHGKINEAVVVPKADNDDSLYLCAYYTSSVKVTNEEIIEYLSSSLPSYMIPSTFVRITEMPLTPNGKTDRKSLPEPDNYRPELQVEYEAPQTDVHSKIIDVWREILQVEKIGIRDNFFDIGGNSLRLIRVSSKLTEVLNTEVPITTLFQYPTVQSLANFLQNKEESIVVCTQNEVAVNNEVTSNISNETDIAIIGMSCRFPGSDNIEEFWDNLQNGVECISFFKDEELINSGVDPKLVADPNYVKAQGVMNNPEYFDSEFFKYSPREAEIMDPQVRVFHEVVWAALEDSGYSPYSYNKQIGLFSCASPNLFWESLVALSNKTQILGEFASEQLFNKDYMSTRISYKLNLTGPSVSLYTACSSSLVAVHMACESLINKECNIAIAGSSTISPLPDKTGYLFQDGMVKSPDGHCKAFDINAAGFVGGTGTGAIILKRLSDAIKDRDNIQAVIKASAINNDGSNKVGYTAPSIDGQKKVIQEALRKAGATPESIGYIEAHGTATPLGDSVEIEALKQAFNTDNKNFCGIGSVKTNIGHLDCTAGIAGLIKTALALNHRLIPPTLNVSVANPKLNLISSPFYLVTEAMEWNNNENEMPLRAGISSLGLGGTNAHIIVEEPPLVENEDDERPFKLILISARSETALNNQKKQLATHLDKYHDINMADLAYTLQAGRTHFAYRSAIVAEDRANALEQLTDSLPHTICHLDKDAYTIFNFVSSGITNVINWIELYKTEAIFKKVIDECILWLSPYMDTWFINAINRQGEFSCEDEIKENIFILFSLQLALAKTLIFWGIRPDLTKGGKVADAINMALSNKDGFEKIADAVILNLKQIKESFEELEVGFKKEELAQEKACIYIDFDGNHCGIVENDIKAKVEFNINSVEKAFASRLLLEKLGQLWMLGVSVNWENFYNKEKRKRISLPTYPFERQKYWIEGNPFEISPKNKIEDTSKKEDMSDWFYVPLWEQSILSDYESDNGLQVYPGWMVFMDDTAFQAKLINELEAKVGSVIRITKGESFCKIGDNNYQINFKDENDYIKLIDSIKGAGNLPCNMVSLWGITAEDDNELSKEKVYEELDLGFYSITFLAKALMKQSSADKTRIIVVTNHLYNVDGTGKSRPAKAAVLGPCKVIPQELSFVRCKNIDITIPEVAHIQDKLICKLIYEMSGNFNDTSVAYRNNIRYVQTYNPVRLTGKSSKFKNKGVYLITGGLGNIGFSIAEYLAKEYQAKLVLIGRTVFPNREDRENWLIGKNDNEPISERVKRIIELEKLGAEIYAYSGDISDYNAINSIVLDAESKVGKINGVIHAAGTMRESLYKTLDEVNRIDCIKQFEPKIFGTMVLHNLFKNSELDFFTVTSSTSSVLGGLGFTAYSAANIFMDSFISEFNRTSGKEWISVNWEGWKFNVEGIQLSFDFAMSELFMSPEEGVEVFNRVTNSQGFERIVVSSGSLNNRLDRWISLNKTDLESEKKKKSEVEIDRNILKTKYVSPENKMETAIAEIFQDFFGYKEIGIHDNFFDLGASSLDIIQITGNLRKSLNMNISILKLFTYPTVYSLAQNLLGCSEETAITSSNVDRKDEFKKGKSSIQQRYNLRKNK